MQTPVNPQSMAQVINTNNQFNTILFTKEQTFNEYLSKVSIILPKFLIVYPEQILVSFENIMKELLVLIGQILVGKQHLEHCMQLYNHVILTQAIPFKFVHNTFIQYWCGQILLEETKQEETKQELMDIESQTCEGETMGEEMEEDEEEEENQIPIGNNTQTETVVAHTTFTRIDQSAKPFVAIPLPLPSKAADVPHKNWIHVYVDALNFFAAILRVHNSKPEEMGFMDLDRFVETHQFDSETEITRSFEQALKFFDSAVPHGSSIHFVFKKFGNNHIWSEFRNIFAKTFWNSEQPSKHYFDYYVALGTDPEIDDLATVRLAIERSMMDIRNKAHILSNDYYRSMPSKWHIPTQYTLVTRDRQESNKMKYLDLADSNDIPKIRFQISTAPSENNLEIAEIRMRMLGQICA